MSQRSPINPPRAAWTAPPAMPVVAASEVHVWRAPLEPATVHHADAESVLDRAECGVAARFRSDDDRRRYTLSHAVLRDVLARYLGVAAQHLELFRDARGKPHVSRGGAQHELRFNMSHGRTLVLVAVAWRREVGVDVEAIAADATDQRLAQRRFAPREIALLQALPAAARPTAFFRIWTRKEAYLKALGHGLSVPLDCVDTTRDVVEPADIAADRSARWSLHSIDPGGGCAAALAVQGTEVQLTQFDWC